MLTRNNLVYPHGLRLSALELMIVAAIGLAMVGVSVPMYQSGVAYYPGAAARQDLDNIRNALILYEEQDRRFVGSSLQPLVRYLQEIPRDPWDSDYLIAADAGLVLTFGADGRPGGQDEDADIVVQFRPKSR